MNMWRVVCTCGLLAALGCGAAEPRGEVEGVVRCNGKPLTDVVVVFVPDADQGTRGARALGQTDAEGRYRLRGEDRRAGAAAGTHRVVIEDLAVYAAPRQPDGTLLRKPAPRFPPQYGDPLRTPLRKQVQTGSQVIDLELPGP
jgi:hypothetical protein